MPAPLKETQQLPPVTRPPSAAVLIINNEIDAQKEESKYLLSLFTFFLSPDLGEAAW